VFINQSAETVALNWMTPDGRQKSYGSIAAGKQVRRRTRPGAVWLKMTESGEELGYFRMSDRSSKAIVPK